MARRAASWGFYLSLAGPITYPRSEGLRELASRLPLSCLVVEADCPYLAPQSHRGRRNEPAYVAKVAETLARVHARDIGDVEQITTENARLLFALPKREDPVG